MWSLEASFPCESRELSQLRRQLAMWLQEAGVPRGLLVRMVLATHEAAANAVRHANPCSNLKLWAAIDERFVTVEIADTGTWSGEVIDNGDEEHGRGIVMIRDLMAQVEIHTSPEGTTVRMREPLLVLPSPTKNTSSAPN